MLSNALRVGHRPVNSKKAREKRVETQASRPAPAPVQPAGEVQQRPIVWKHVALGTAAVGVHLHATALAAAVYVPDVVSRLLSGKVLDNDLLLGFDTGVVAANTGVLLALLLSGALLFRKQQRVPMLLNALAWEVLLDRFPTAFHRAEWLYIMAAACTLSVAFALGKRAPQEPEAPIESV